jgi:flagellar biosynthetic protein FlhB
MALFSDDSGKTEKATPQRLGEARDKGQTPISREFTMAGSLLVAAVALEAAGPWLIDSFLELLRLGLDVASARRRLTAGEIGDATELLRDAAAIALPSFAFLLAVFLLATLVFGYAQIGLRISKRVLQVKLERLDPAKNLARLLNVSSFARALLSLLKLIALGSILWLVLHNEWRVLAGLHDVDSFAAAVALIADLAFTILFWIALIVLALSVGDIAWQRYQFHKNLMMSKQEVDDERKRTEGDPLIKSRLRSARLELMRQRMMDSVPKADVVITNPTHYSVALRYDRSRNSAPEVVAKGMDDLALRIRELAREHRVPLMEDPPLARALYRVVKVGQEIPERFYRAVAAVLSHVLRFKGRVA